MKQEKTVLITGASSGIGYELAKLFARDGYDLVIVARSEQQLTDVANGLKAQYGSTVKVIAKDLAQPNAAQEIFDELQQAQIPVDIVVNNAGYATYGLFAELDAITELNMLQVNIVALTHLTKLFLPPMIKRGWGKILNVASTAAFQPGPLMAVYYASKAYVLSFSEALANEVHGTGVSVTVLCPGATASGFQKRAGMEDSKLVSGRKIMDAATVAQAGYRALMTNKTSIVPGFSHRFLAFSTRFVPRQMAAWMARNMQESVHTQ